MGRRSTRIDQEREDGGCGSRSSASGNGCAHVYGICKMPHQYKKWFSKEPLMGLAHFILTQVFWTNVKSVKCCSAWMPVARGLKLAMR